jgi:uncharacterized C2H2 Zn-finger protein
MTDKKTPKNPTIFICENCDFKSSNKKDYKRHLGTAKHKILTNTDNNGEKKWECICGKIYKHRQSYHKHKMKCNYKTPEELKELSMWRTLYPSNKKENGIGHCRRKRSFSI